MIPNNFIGNRNKPHLWVEFVGNGRICDYWCTHCQHPTLIIVWHNSRRQHILQVKITSVQLVLHFLEYWKDAKHEEFQEALKRIHESKIKKDDHAILPVLTIFEDIAILWHEKTLTDNHVKEFFGNPLRDIRDNEIMQDRIKKESKSESDFILVNLRALLRETVKWKI